MTLRELAALLGWETQSEGSSLDSQVQGGYCGDLLSHALTSAKPGEIWITIQRHANVVAVVQVAGLAGVVLACGARAAEGVVEKARGSGVAVFSSPDPTFVLAAKVHRALFPERC